MRGFEGRVCGAPIGLGKESQTHTLLFKVKGHRRGGGETTGPADGRGPSAVTRRQHSPWDAFPGLVPRKHRGCLRALPAPPVASVRD